ncbi:MAG: twin-arginine translocase TatA/TatE family subunit [Desulfovibrio sp.]|nr:twin-arginine translocase TatA/TatE family subunit [Desulfovibrio sp.]
MFGIGSTELLVILLVGLIVLGPKSLAGLSRTIGKIVGEFRRVSTDFQRTLNVEAAMEEARETKKSAMQEKEHKGEEEKNGEETYAEKLAARKHAVLEKMQRNKNGQGESSAQEPSDVSPSPDGEPVKTPPSPPEGSPLADALAKARAEAMGTNAEPPHDGSVKDGERT